MNMVAVVVALVAIYFSYQGYQSYGIQHLSSLGFQLSGLFCYGLLLKGSSREKQAATPIQLPVETLLP